MRSRALPATLIANLAAQPEMIFADQATWSAQLDRAASPDCQTPESQTALRGYRLASRPDPMRIVIEGA